MTAPEDPNGPREALARAEAERDAARRERLPHMCRDDHPEIRHAVSDDDERCPVCRERDRALAAEAEITRLKEGMEALGAALEPFATFAEDMVDDEGWCSLEYRASISTWFGPSQFRTARQALATLSPKDQS